MSTVLRYPNGRFRSICISIKRVLSFVGWYKKHRRKEVGYKLADMIYTELHEDLPEGFEMLLMASQNLISECYGNGIVCLSMPLKVQDLINTVNLMAEGVERRRRKRRMQPKVRNAADEKTIKDAKELLMARNHMTEEEAHRYLQKTSMDSGTNLVETAQMVLSMMTE